jgi:hypothetical protein
MDVCRKFVGNDEIDAGTGFPNEFAHGPVVTRKSHVKRWHVRCSGALHCGLEKRPSYAALAPVFFDDQRDLSSRVRVAVHFRNTSKIAPEERADHPRSSGNGAISMSAHYRRWYAAQNGGNETLDPGRQTGASHRAVQKT